jgi:uptake hydrogenase large subunit
MSQRILGPFSRVEGDLEVKVDIDSDRVKEAWVTSPQYRGFEQILHGKEPRDALVYTPRICGICSVSQSMAAAAALADAHGAQRPDNGILALNLMLANENVADHLTHFYVFFMPDFTREIYESEKWHASTLNRFQAGHGTASGDVLPARAEFLHLMGILAGKWPHSLSIQPGGSTRAVDWQEKSSILSNLHGFRRFLERHLFGDKLENITSLNSAEALDEWRTREAPEHSDFRRFLHISESLELEKLGQAGNSFLSYGAYQGVDGKHLLSQGVWHDGAVGTLKTEAIMEDLSHSWMAHQNTPRHPFEGITHPKAEAENGYTWCKAPRLDGEVMEVGALARQLIDGHPLIVDLVARSGGNVRNRVIARLLEIARVIPSMEVWANDLKPGEPFYMQHSMLEDAQGAGLVEAARGSLGHWLHIKNGRIFNYQIIAPTTWNFSPRDRNDCPGALEQALVGAPVRKGEVDPVSVQHIVRSFDPCMVCTVH